MSIDRSLKLSGALSRHRNVLTRAERIERLKEDERWSEEDSIFGLPKVAHRKSHAGRKAAKEKEAEEAAAIEGAGALAETPEAEEKADTKTKKAEKK